MLGSWDWWIRTPAGCRARTSWGWRKRYRTGWSFTFNFQLIIQIKTNHCCRFLASSVILFTEKEKAKLFQNYVTGEFTKPIFNSKKVALFKYLVHFYLFQISPIVSGIPFPLSLHYNFGVCASTKIIIKGSDGNQKII